MNTPTLDDLYKKAKLLTEHLRFLSADNHLLSDCGRFEQFLSLFALNMYNDKTHWYLNIITKHDALSTDTDDALRNEIEDILCSFSTQTQVDVFRRKLQRIADAIHSASNFIGEFSEESQQLIPELDRLIKKKGKSDSKEILKFISTHEDQEAASLALTKINSLEHARSFLKNVRLIPMAFFWITIQSYLNEIKKPNDLKNKRNDTGSSPKTVRDTLEKCFAYTSKYSKVMGLLAEENLCDPVTYIWIDKKSGHKALIVELIKHLHAKGFFNGEEPSSEETILIAQNTFHVTLSKETVIKTQIGKKFCFIGPASTF